MHYVNIIKSFSLPIKKVTLNDPGYPELLRQIPGAPEALFYKGAAPAELLKLPTLAIVGSRKMSRYGQAVTDKLAREVAGAGIIIVSGLALGIDSIGHKAALEMGAPTIAVLPCGLDDVYPHSHRHLAKQILDRGGTLISEYTEGTPPRQENFIARNRIVSGLSQGVLITEAAEKSGTWHTAKFALEQGREVMAVPGNITSALSAGTNRLIKTGATPVTSLEDILNTLRLEKLKKPEVVGSTEEEAVVLRLLKGGPKEEAELLYGSKLSAQSLSQTLTMLEISGKIHSSGGYWSL